MVNICAGSMTIACKSAERAKHVSCLSNPGLPPSFAKDTCRIMAAMASYVLRQAPAKAHASRHAAARKSLKHRSKALRSQLKVLFGQQMRY